jgi:enamine deaminase RidA (YjgF/YER057c/UK114 family)
VPFVARGRALGRVMSGLERIDPPELPRPSGFAHAVVGAGRTVFLAGQTGTDADGRIVQGGVVAQFEQALQNLLTALRAAGGGPEHLAQLTIYIVDIDDYRVHAREIGAVWRRLVGTRYPATAGIGVARLWDPEALVELQGTALLAD